jgi:toxin ParE1/3/4
MAEVIWTDLAVEDINDIAEYIAKSSQKYATIQTQRFFDRALILESNPFAGKQLRESNDKNYRELNAGNYRIIYKVASDSLIYILSVIQGSTILNVENLPK